ncbi:DUF3021 domain-containing protein [Lactobacillus delbrueckii subsp. lactis]|uniref:DUF3021 domain-containing protein n=1 Tax=Lactobacillus delbrueckii TaxID=1584 RepID=UPI001E42B267|nr:DUF3021 domain-containing protein [Lactobacillus delbrueckii]MCD5436982.1 DUF3021 domain-containing protein [Lactobacillus delbrueckii subsp. lactis]
MSAKKNILVSSLIGIGIAAVSSCLVSLLLLANGAGSLTMTVAEYTQMLAGIILVGLGFGLPSIVYQNDKLAPAYQVLIHMGTGCLVMTLVSFWTGWIPVKAGFWPAFLTIAGEIAVSFIVWLIFYQQEKKLAQKMNNRIKQLKK